MTIASGSRAGSEILSCGQDFPRCRPRWLGTYLGAGGKLTIAANCGRRRTHMLSPVWHDAGQRGRRLGTLGLDARERPRCVCVCMYCSCTGARRRAYGYRSICTCSRYTHALPTESVVLGCGWLTMLYRLQDEGHCGVRTYTYIQAGLETRPVSACTRSGEKKEKKTKKKHQLLTACIPVRRRWAVACTHPVGRPLSPAGTPPVRYAQ